MTIIELSILETIDYLVNLAPFVFQTNPGAFTLASYWTDTFGAPDDSSSEIVSVNSVFRGSDVVYDKQTSLLDCISQEKSFYFDFATQKLYIHFEHDQSWYTDFYQSGEVTGFSDDQLVYIDDIEYLPVIKSVPSVAQQQDFIGYDRLAFVNGSVTLSNNDGELDRFIDENIYGNEVYMYSLSSGADSVNADRNDLTSLASFFVEDYDFSLQEFTLRVQDRRKSQNITIPRDDYNTTDYSDLDTQFSGVPIPVIYGQIRELECTPTNSALTSGNVDFRAGLLLTNIGTVQVLIDDVWTTVTPDSTSLSTGEFTLLAADARETSGAVRQCKIVSPIGIAITYTSDIIKDLNERFLGVLFNDSNYNTTEWNSEETSLSTGGVVFDTEIDLFEAIRIVQNGSIDGFRYEINPIGQRTIRIDDFDRASSGRIENVSIQNIDVMSIETDTDIVFAEVKIKYSKSYVSGRFLSETNDDFFDQVVSDYRQRTQKRFETILNNLSDAQTRALDNAEKFSVIRPMADLTVMDEDLLDIRIYDIYDIELTPGIVDADDSNSIIGREYFGVKKCQIIGIDPDPKTKTNRIIAVIIEDAA